MCTEAGDQVKNHSSENGIKTALETILLTWGINAQVSLDGSTITGFPRARVADLNLLLSGGRYSFQVPRGQEGRPLVTLVRVEAIM